MGNYRSGPCVPSIGILDEDISNGLINIISRVNYVGQGTQLLDDHTQSGAPYHMVLLTLQYLLDILGHRSQLA